MACSKVNVCNEPSVDGENIVVTESPVGRVVTVKASAEQPGAATKTSLGEGNSVVWSAGDAFSVVRDVEEVVKDQLTVVLTAGSTGVAVPVTTTSSSALVKYSYIKVTSGSTDVTSTITSTSASSSNSYKVGIYNSGQKYQYAPAGTAVTAEINTTGNCIPLVQASSSSSVSTSSPITVVLRGIQYSLDNGSSWVSVNENTTLLDGSSWGKSNVNSKSWDYSNGTSSVTANIRFNVTSTTDGTFEGTIDGPEVDAYAMYPYSADCSVGDGVVTFTMPQTQTYVEGSFAAGANPMVGVMVKGTDEEYSVEFKNVCGVMRIALTGTEDVTSLAITDKAGKSLWGTATIDVDEIGTSGATVSGGSATLTLDCSDGVQLSADDPTYFYFVVPVGSFASGFDLALTVNSGSLVKYATKSTVKSNLISRSTIKAMPTIATSSLSFSFPIEEFNVENKTVQDIMANSYSVFTSGSSSYLNNSTYTTNRDNALTGSAPYRNDQPATKTISLSGTGTATVIMATDDAYSNVVLSASVDLSDGSYVFKNMVPGKTYYYRVVKDSDTITEGAFKATGQLRMIKIDRSWNMRDMGGWTGWGGNKVKYEWIYRGGSIGGQSTSGTQYLLTDDEYEELHRLGIRSHLDLRSMPNTGAWPNGTQLNGHSLGDTVLLIDGDVQQITTDWCTLYSTENGAAVGNLAYIIKSLKAGRPVYFNCRTGADRTGTMGMVVLGILGCDEYTAGNNGNQIAIDYEMTSLGMDEEGTINYNTYGTISGYSSRVANSIWSSGYNFFRTVRNFSSFTDNGVTISLNNYQEKMYYYLNRYFYDNSVSTAGSVYLNKSDIDWFVNFMLGTEDFEGPSWAKEYTDNSLEHVIFVADAHELYHSTTYGSIGPNVP